MKHFKGSVGTSLTKESKLPPEDGRISITAKFNSKCCLCRNSIKEGSRIWWRPGDSKVWHLGCNGEPKKPKRKKKGKGPASRPARGRVRLVS